MTLNGYMIFFQLIIILMMFVLLVFKLKKIKKSYYFERKIFVILFLFFVFFLIVIYRLFFIQVLSKEKYIKKINDQTVRYDAEIGKRGIILDANGKQLAFNKVQYYVVINPKTIHHNNDELLLLLHEISREGILEFETNFFENLEVMYENQIQYKRISHKVDEAKKKKIEELISENKNSTRVNILKRNLFFEEDVVREYFSEELYSDFIGQVKFNENSSFRKIGVSGIEKQYEDYLSGSEVKKRRLYARDRRMVLPMSLETIMTDLNGKNIYLTIDNYINYILNEEIEKQFINTNSEEAIGIIMNPNNGKILGMASYNRDKNSMRNPIFQNQYEPGSIFKPLIVAAALNEGLITENTEFNIGDGTISIGSSTIKEASKNLKGVLNTKDIIKKSSNVGMVLISKKISNKTMDDYLTKFGLYKKTGVDFPDELTPKKIPLDNLTPLKKANISFGQGIAITPVQMITSFSATINGGKLYRPYIVEKVVTSDGIVVKRNLPKKIDDVITEQVSKKMRNFLEETVERGTGKKGSVDSYKVGGKTGTGQIATKGGYLKEEYLSSFIGFFPVENPQYVLLIMFNKPKADNVYSRYGGSVAAPVFAEIAKKILAEKSIPSENVSTIFVEPFKDYKFDEKIDLDNGLMPDLTGLSAKEVINNFKDTDIEIQIEGFGLVYKQTPTIDTDLEKVKLIKIYLK